MMEARARASGGEQRGAEGLSVVVESGKGVGRVVGRSGHCQMRAVAWSGGAVLGVAARVGARLERDVLGNRGPGARHLMYWW